MKRLWIPMVLLVAFASVSGCSKSSNPPPPPQPTPGPTMAPLPPTPAATAKPACKEGEQYGVPVNGKVVCYKCVNATWAEVVCDQPPSPVGTPVPVATKKPTPCTPSANPCKFEGPGPNGGVFKGDCLVSPSCKPSSVAGYYEGDCTTKCK